MAPPTFDAALGATVLSAETEIPWDLGRLRVRLLSIVAARRPRCLTLRPPTGAADFRPLRTLSDLKVSLATRTLATEVMACIEVATASMLPSVRLRLPPKRCLRMTTINSR